ncbi:hypothetical protein L1049_005104 [Liquidambar formosana]|uniref:Uncharacterized protein n=1 Tax=Liquidambar formosana TaxID=63359 RepID=A0AAP0RPB7_LIQFO
MVLEQTLLLTKTISSIPKNPFSNTQISSSSPPLNLISSLCLFSSPSQSNIKRPGFNRRLKCSMDYSNGHYNQVVYPKPSEVPWKKELCNSVQLIGIVGKPIEIKHLPSGKVLAWTRLAVKKSATDTAWINLTFWDELAQVAFQHVEKGHQIYVSGRLVSDTVETDDGKQQTYYKVVVQQLNFVERNFSSVALYDQETNSMASGRKLGNYTANSAGSASTEELWQAFFANPVEWWDNRKNKRSPKYPDFKHKDTGEALWVEGRYNPPWVKSQLAIMDTRMESLHDQNVSRHANFMAGDDFMPF